MKVLIACEFSGIVREAFRKGGHDAWSCDLLPTETEGQHIQGDVLRILNNRWDLMIAFPPCTYLTVTGNRWFNPKYTERFPNRQEDREKAVNFFMDLASAHIEKICIENPVGIMSTRWRKPDQIIQPYHFGHSDSKKTCLWLKKLPPLMATLISLPEWHKNPDGTDYKDSGGSRYSETHFHTGRLSAVIAGRIRSRTYQGIANAMAAQWG